jgi:hypothetical protein
MTQMTIMTGEDRRRKWPLAERERILSAAFAPGAVVAKVARQFDVASSLIYTWRRQAAGIATVKPVSFSPAILIEQAKDLAPEALLGSGLFSLPLWLRGSNRVGRSSIPARPYAARLSIFSRLICPSVLPVAPEFRNCVPRCIQFMGEEFGKALRRLSGEEISHLPFLARLAFSARQEF